ncbi:MAG: peptidylprolyl isomerase [Pseudomonadota bacterium]
MARVTAFGLFVLTIVSCARGDVDSDSEVTAGGVRVDLATNLGVIQVEVYPEKAPLSAGDFLEYVDSGRYSAASFYRVVRPDNDNGDPKISVIQGGVRNTDNAEASSAAAEDQQSQSEAMGIVHETTEQTGLRHTDGALSLARTDPGTGSARAFFIVIGDQPSLDFGGMRNKDGQGFAVFGRVTGGMDVVKAINALPGDAPVENAYVKGQILEEPIAFTAQRSVGE